MNELDELLAINMTFDASDAEKSILSICDALDSIGDSGVHAAQKLRGAMSDMGSLEDARHRIDAVARSVQALSRQYEEMKSKNGSNSVTAEMMSVSEQLSKQQNILRIAQTEWDRLNAAYENGRNILATVTSGMEGATAAQALANTAISANAIANISAASAKVVNTGATGNLAVKTHEETNALREQSSATEKASEDTQKYAAIQKDLRTQIEDLRNEWQHLNAVYQSSPVDSEIGNEAERRMAKIQWEINALESLSSQIRNDESHGKSFDARDYSQKISDIGESKPDSEITPQEQTAELKSLSEQYSVLKEQVSLAESQVRQYDDAIKACYENEHTSGETLDELNKKRAEAAERYEQLSDKAEVYERAIQRGFDAESGRSQADDELRTRTQEYEQLLQKKAEIEQNMYGGDGANSDYLEQEKQKHADILEQLARKKREIEEIEERQKTGLPTIDAIKDAEHAAAEEIRRRYELEEQERNAKEQKRAELEKELEVQKQITAELQKDYDYNNSFVGWIKGTKYNMGQQSADYVFRNDEGGTSNLADLNKDEFQQKISDAIEDSKSRVKELQDELNRLNGVTEETGNAAENANIKASQSADDANQKERARIEDLKEYTKFLQEENEKRSESTKSIKEEAEQVNALKGELEQCKEGLANLNKEKADATSTEHVNALNAAISATKERISNIEEDIKSATGTTTSFKDATSKLSEALASMGIPLGGVKKGFLGVLSAMRAMIATPVGAVIMAIAAALKLFHTWLGKSKKGQDLMAYSSAALGSIMQSLTDIVIIVGDTIWKVFSGCKQPVIDMVKSWISAMKSAVKAFGDAFSVISNGAKGVWQFVKGDFGDAAESFAKVKDGVKNFGANLKSAFKGLGDAVVSGVKTGVTGATGIINSFSDGTLSKAMGKIGKTLSNGVRNAHLEGKMAVEEKSLDRDMAVSQSENIKIDNEIQKKRQELGTLTGKAKVIKIAEIESLTRQKYEKQKEILRRKANIAETRASMHEGTYDSAKNVRSANDAASKIGVQEERELARYSRMKGAAQRQANKNKNGKNDARNAREQLAKLEYNHQLDEESLAFERLVLEKEKAISEEKDAHQRKVMQRELARLKEREAIKKKEQQFLSENISEAEQSYNKDPKNKKQEGFFSRGLYKNVTLNESQSAIIQAEKDALDAKYTSEDEERIKQEKQRSERAMIDYLKQYGSYQQQKEALARETAAKIREINEDAEATAEEKMYKIAALQEELVKSQSSLDMAAFKDSIDWEGVFNNLDRMGASSLESLRDKLRKFLSESKDLSVEDIETISTKIREITDRLSGKKFGIGTFLPETGKAVSEINDRRMIAEQSHAAYEKAKGESDYAAAGAGVQRSIVLEQMKKMGMSESELSDKDSLKDKAKGMKGGDTLIKQLGKLDIAEAKSAKAAEKASKAKQKADADAANAAMNAADYGSLAAGAFSDLGNALTSTGDLMDMFNIGGDEDKERVNAAAEGANAAAGAVTDYMSGNYLGAAMKAFSAVKSFGTALGIGGGNAKEVQKITEENTKAIEKLTDRVNDLKEAIGNSAGQSAIYSYSLALDAQEEVNRLAMETLKAQMSYTKAHHSNQSKIDDDIIASYNAIAQLAFKAAGTDQTEITGLSSIYGLTPEQLKALKDYAPELWKYLTETGDYDKTEYWDAVVDLAGQTEELTEQIYQNLTQTTLDNLRDGFKEFIMEASGSVSDFTTDMSNSMIESLVNSQVLDDTFDSWLEDWRERWAEALKSGTMTQSEKSALLSEYSQMAKEKQAEAEALKASLGYSYTDEQEASRSLIQNITADQADQLIGRIAAIQIAVERHTNEMSVLTPYAALIQADTTAMKAQCESIGGCVSSMMEMQRQGNVHLEQIEVNTRPISEIRDITEKIRKLVEENA